MADILVRSIPSIPIQTMCWAHLARRNDGFYFGSILTQSNESDMSNFLFYHNIAHTVEIKYSTIRSGAISLKIRHKTCMHYERFCVTFRFEG